MKTHSQVKVQLRMKIWIVISLKCSLRVCTAEMKHRDHKAVGKERAYSAYIYIFFHSWRKSGQELRAGTLRQKLMQRPWRNAAYWLAFQSLFSPLSNRTQDHLPRDGHPSWAGPSPPLIIKWGNASQLDLMEAFFSTEAPSSLMTFACVKLAHKTSQYHVKFWLVLQNPFLLFEKLS